MTPVHRTDAGPGEPRRSSSRKISFPQDHPDDHPSPGKRQKLRHEPGTGTSSSASSTAGPSRKQNRRFSTPPRATSTDNMYSFKTDTIDLTSSPARKSGGSPLTARRAAAAGQAGAAAGATTGSAGPKRLVVKNFKHKSNHDPDKYFNQIWDQVDAALASVFALDTASFSLEELYRGVENVCRQNRAADLSRRLVKRCRDHVENVLRIELLSKPAESDVDLLRNTVDAWMTWRKQTAVIKAIFFFLDRSYLLHTASELTIDDLSIDLFRDLVFSHPQIQSRAISGTCDVVAEDRRQGDENTSSSFDEELFRDAIAMYQTMTIYTTRVEPRLLAQLQDYLARWAASNGVKMTLQEFLAASIALKEREVARCERYGLPDTKRDAIKQAELFLIEQQEERLTAYEELRELLDASDVSTLTTLYAWLQFKRLGDKLRAPVARYVDEQGTRIVFDKARESEMVPRLLHLKRQQDAILEKAFEGNQDIGLGAREAFGRLMNKTEADATTGESGNDKPGEMIAKYVDVILKGGARSIPQIGGVAASETAASKAVNEDEMQDDELDEDSAISRQLDSVLELFRFVEGKATFEAFYKKDLAKRLLMNRSASADAEKSMISRLRKECGAAFTHNLEQMFKDMDRSREDNTAYKTLLEDRGEVVGLDLSVSTLSSAAWPSYPDADVEVPADVQRASAAFEAHYRAKYAGRRLAWKHGLAHCQMRARFPLGNKELVLSAFQAVVLLFFNGRPDRDPASYQDLRAATKLPDHELKRTLQSLACAKYRVLSKSPKGKDVNDGDRFLVNLDFKDSRTRIKINQIQLKETPEEQKQTHERVAADRQFETQAAIVRVMKREKNIKHPLLVAEVINALKSRGVINAEDIKKQIAKLIDKDYMEDLGNGEYEYQA